jgi:hypothetical protein
MGEHTIRITGLNERQRNIMDLLWGCNTLEQVNTLIDALPDSKDKQDARALIEIAVQESLEAEGLLDAHKAAAESVIASARRS